jgi:hypothetical protein
MDANWIDDLVRTVQAKGVRRGQSTQLIVAAESQAPEMFKRLCNQISADISQYQSKMADASLQCDVGPERLIIRHQTYPFLDFSMSLTGHSIRIVAVKKRYPDSSNGQTETPVFVVAGDGGEVYYRINGNDQLFANEAEVSERLLRPLLEFIGS